MNAALLQCFVKIGLFQHANAPAAVAAAGAGYRCSLFKYDAERFADGGAARAHRRARQRSRSASGSADTSCPSPRSRRRSGQGNSRPVQQRRPLRGQLRRVLTLETMKISGRSTVLIVSNAAFASSSVANSATCASRLLPMRLSARAVSSTPLTSERTRSAASQTAISVSSSA